MSAFVFRSSLSSVHREALERLVFFNPRQHDAERQIADGVERYGCPEIVADRTELRVIVANRPDVQCLFALAPRRGEPALAGMVMYLRTSIQEIVVLHIAVSRRFGRRRQSSLHVVMALVSAVRDVGHRLRGVERLRLLYVHEEQSHIPLNVRRPRTTSGQCTRVAALQ
jgi:hypothetical protein